jgi:hypothetical protein
VHRRAGHALYEHEGEGAFGVAKPRRMTLLAYPARSMGADCYGHLADGIEPRDHVVARLDRAHPFRRAGIVARIEGVGARAPFDQLPAVLDQLWSCCSA